MNQQQRIGRYQILEEIAAGGQATVYRAWDTSTGQVVALKVMHPHLTRDATYVERFHREAQLAASLDHPNIIRIFEVAQEGDSHFMAMEYLPLSVHNLIEAQGSMPVDRAADIAYQVAQGLEAARQRGIIHRDIKPHNILIGPDGTAKVTDFGIARAGELSTMTRTGAIMGTPHYMSPEQARGQRVDIRSDLYGLGVTLYQMLTGGLPFEADTPWEIIRLHIEARPPALRRGHPNIPRQLESVVSRSLEKNPERRYQTPAEMAQASVQAVTQATQARITGVPVGQQTPTPQRTATPQHTPIPQPAPVQPTTESTVRISNPTAIVGFLLFGMLAGFVLYLLAYGDLYYGIPPVPPILFASVGFAIGFGISDRLHMTGRLPSVMGTVLVAFGLLMLIGDESTLEVVPISMGVYGLGIGFMLPGALWRRIREQSRGSKIGLAMAAIASIVMSWYFDDGIGLAETSTLAGMIAVFIGLPLALMSPLVKTVLQSTPAILPGATPQPSVGMVGGLPSDTWMDAWASAWQKANRRRFAWIGTALTLGIGLALTLARFGAFDDLLNQPTSIPNTVSTSIGSALGGSAIATLPGGQSFEVTLPPGAVDGLHTLTLRPLREAELGGCPPSPATLNCSMCSR